ncbi:hypothetical protein NX786_24385 [Telluria mixta]|uniref:Lipoprotein n=1 Tax=Telluria mixta TaxID=34071 RepID=A0ABT2C6N5_9BURK|nr:hypothetical protein [Telluria mixta]MCS0632476.1 hypothetical protein [Telluria mixta]WEM99225.1 hypothetical protein P0M04_16395 [Telluria mixta]
MKLSYLLLFAAGMPLLACAQADQAMPAAADPDAPVAPLQYRSVFEDHVAAKEPARSPDKAWVAANRAVAGADGEADKHEHGGARQ